MDALLFLAFAFLLLMVVGGMISLQHAVIKPVVDWLEPPKPAIDLDIANLLKGVEELDELEQDICKPKKTRKPKKSHKPALQPSDRAGPDGSRALLRALEEQYAQDERKRHMRAAIAEHERRPKPPRYMP